MNPGKPLGRGAVPDSQTFLDQVNYPTLTEYSTAWAIKPNVYQTQVC